jgi:hypothetical protein
MADERRKDYNDLSEIKISLAVLISELENTNKNLKRLDNNQDIHQKWILDIRDKVNISFAKLYGGWIAATILSGFIGFIMKDINHIRDFLN